MSHLLLDERYRFLLMLYSSSIEGFYQAFFKYTEVLVRNQRCCYRIQLLTFSQIADCSCGVAER